MRWEIRNERGHYAVYLNGKFYCTADTKTEALREIAEAEED